MPRLLLVYNNKAILFEMQYLKDPSSVQAYLATLTKIPQERQLLFRHPEDLKPMEVSEVFSLPHASSIYLRDSLQENANNGRLESSSSVDSSPHQIDSNVDSSRCFANVHVEKREETIELKNNKHHGARFAKNLEEMSKSHEKSLPQEDENKSTCSFGSSISEIDSDLSLISEDPDALLCSDTCQFLESTLGAHYQTTEENTDEQLDNIDATLVTKNSATIESVFTSNQLQMGLNYLEDMDAREMSKWPLISCDTSVNIRGSLKENSADENMECSSGSSNFELINSVMESSYDFIDVNIENTQSSDIESSKERSYREFREAEKQQPDLPLRCHPNEGNSITEIKSDVLTIQKVDAEMSNIFVLNPNSPKSDQATRSKSEMKSGNAEVQWQTVITTVGETCNYDEQLITWCDQGKFITYDEEKNLKKQNLVNIKELEGNTPTCSKSITTTAKSGICISGNINEIERSWNQNLVESDQTTQATKEDRCDVTSIQLKAPKNRRKNIKNSSVYKNTEKIEISHDRIQEISGDNLADSYKLKNTVNIKTSGAIDNLTSDIDSKLLNEMKFLQSSILKIKLKQQHRKEREKNLKTKISVLIYFLCFTFAIIAFQAVFMIFPITFAKGSIKTDSAEFNSILGSEIKSTVSPCDSKQSEGNIFQIKETEQDFNFLLKLVQHLTLHERLPVLFTKYYHLMGSN